MTTTPLAIPSRAHLEEFFARVDPVRGRLVFAIDATASRQPTWDLAAQLQAEMFGEVDGLDVQLVYYRGIDQFVASPWCSNSQALASAMSRVECRAGHTQIAKVLRHAHKENAYEKIAAVVLISDASEEISADLYAEAHELNVPVFMFQEGANDRVTAIYKKISDVTGGAYSKFDTKAARRLADLLNAVAVFSTGGVKALTARKTAAAKLLLAQIQKKQIA